MRGNSLNLRPGQKDYTSITCEASTGCARNKWPSHICGNAEYVPLDRDE